MTALQFLPCDRAALDDEGRTRGQTRLARRAPVCLPVGQNGIIASATASLRDDDDSLRAQEEEVQAQMAALSAQLCATRYGWMNLRRSRGFRVH